MSKSFYSESYQNFTCFSNRSKLVKAVSESFEILTLITLRSSKRVLHSMLVAYTILVPTLKGNRWSRLHGFQQHCMAG